MTARLPRAAKAKSIFQSDSDDSVAMDSTVQSEFQDEYVVDKVLTERWNPKKRAMEYLIKWEGYTLDRTSWEPKESFSSDSTLRDWNEAKHRIELGQEQPFDLSKVERACRDAETRKRNRQRRRRHKRLKLGLEVSDHGSDTNDELPGFVKELPTSVKRKKTSNVEYPEQRKGIARKINPNIAKPLAASAHPDIVALTTESDKAQRVTASPDHVDVKERPASTAHHDATAFVPPEAEALPTSIIRAFGSRKDDVAELSSHITPGAHHSAEVRTMRDPEVTQTARKSKALRARTAEKKGGQKARQTNTDKNFSKLQFRNLAEQHRFRKHYAVEKAPDTGALQMVDPETGKMSQARSSGQEAGMSISDAQEPLLGPAQPNVRRLVSSRISSIYGRRSPSPAGNQGYASPLDSQEQVKSHEFVQQHVGEARDSTINSEQRGYMNAAKQICRYWQRGDCVYSAEECRFLHHVPVGHESTMLSEEASSNIADCHVTPAETTCHFWFTLGRCFKPDHICKFAHRDTGIYARQPGSYKQNFSKQSGPTANSSLDAQTNLPVQTTHEGRGVVSSDSSERSRSPSPGPSTVLQSCTLQTVAPQTGARQIRAEIPLKSQPNSEFILCITLKISFDGRADTTCFTATLKSSKTVLVKTLPATKSDFHAKQLIMAKDFQNIIRTGESRDTDIAEGSLTMDDASLATTLIEICKSHASGLVASLTDSNTKMLVYPCDDEAWKFLQRDSPDLNRKSALRFRIYHDTSGESESCQIECDTKTNRKLRPSTEIGEIMADLDKDRLLFSLANTSSSRTVFLMVPPSRQAEVEVLVKYFEGLRLKVYSSNTAGDWAYFRKMVKKPSLLIIHTDVPIWKIPGLQEFLSLPNAPVPVFSVGVDHDPTALEGHDGPSFLCKRVFPHGRVVFITDDVFAYHPERATDVIEAFLDSTRHKPFGAENSKIAARPGLKEWLFMLTLENTDNRGRKDARWIRLYNAVCRLCPPEAEDPWDRPNPLPDSLLISISPALLPSFSGLWEKDETKATDYLVNWFAGWAVLNASRFRKFVVCHELPDELVTMETDEQSSVDPQGWAAKYQHIAVMPAKIVSRILGPRK